MRKILAILVVVLAGCAGYPMRDIGTIAGAAVGAEANARYPIRGAVAGGIVGALAGAMVDSVYGPIYGPNWRYSERGRYWSSSGEGTRCDTNTTTDHRTGAVTMIRRCDSRLEHLIPGGIESCFASFEARSVNGAP